MALQGAEAVEANRDQDRTDVCFNSLLPAPLLESNKDIINHISVLVPLFWGHEYYMHSRLYVQGVGVRMCSGKKWSPVLSLFLCWTFYFLDRLLCGSHAAWGTFHDSFTFNLDLPALSLVFGLSLHFRHQVGLWAIIVTWLKWLVFHCVILGGLVLRLRGSFTVCIHGLSCFWDLTQDFPSEEITTTSGISQAALEHIIASWISTFPTD